ncbi:flagellar hook-associated protein 2 [Clostridium sp. CAG:221]|uniref:flagellar filament capping protein FliD n=1 Tax=Clostridium sp. CAG:221 TaxID=1262780 RepID=UPI00033A45B5|nr:flagellar filament capping protein FliD [Clostridium sp. CAG:221]CDB14792.1 flagellar hook-associated protein 2 [Clostridium sp. CAG:221]
MTRITGLATGLDVDSLVQETMQAYQTKIDTVDQQKKVVELQQEMYREVITDCRNFYNDYFDISKSNSIILQKNWSATTFESSSSAVTVTGGAGAEAANYSVKVESIAKAASFKLESSNANGTVYINNVKVELGNDKSDAEKVKLINEALKDKGVTAKYSDFEKGIVLTTTKLGSDETISFTTQAPKTENQGSDYFEKLVKDFEAGKGVTTDKGKKEFTFKVDATEVKVDCTDGISEDKIKSAMKKAGMDVVEEKSGGFKITYPADSSATNIVNGTDCRATITKDGKTYEVVGNKTNNITLDGVTFKFNNIINEEIQITGKADVTKVKENIVKFVNDYNKLMEKLNTLITEKRDKSYMPLTDAQKKEMSESEIELWEKKVKEGQLSRDSDLTRIRNAMKSTMSSLVGGTSSSLKSIGITPVSDYNGTKNGTFTIDEDKLTSALESNMEDVMKLFVSTGTDKDESDKGLLQKLKSVFDTETQTNKGSLIKKAGIVGSSTASNNTLSKQIIKYEEKISRMQTIFSSKQQALYTKYSRLETLMNNLNSQSNYLTSMLSS